MRVLYIFIETFDKGVEMKKKFLLAICLLLIFSQAVHPRRRKSKRKKNIMEIQKKEEDKTRFSFTENGYAVLPRSDLKELIKTGYGSSVEISMDLKPWVLGGELGFFRFSGREKNTDKFTMAPLLFSVGYRIKVYKSFFILPQLYSGFSIDTLYYNNSQYIDDYTEPVYSSSIRLDPVVKMNLRFGYRAGRFHFSLGGGLGMFFEKSGPLLFTPLFLSLGVRW